MRRRGLPSQLCLYKRAHAAVARCMSQTTQKWTTVDASLGAAASSRPSDSQVNGSAATGPLEQFEQAVQRHVEAGTSRHDSRTGSNVWHAAASAIRGGAMPALVVRSLLAAPASPGPDLEAVRAVAVQLHAAQKAHPGGKKLPVAQAMLWQHVAAMLGAGQLASVSPRAIKRTCTWLLRRGFYTELHVVLQAAGRLAAATGLQVPDAAWEAGAAASVAVGGDSGLAQLDEVLQAMLSCNAEVQLPFVASSLRLSMEAAGSLHALGVWASMADAGAHDTALALKLVRGACQESVDAGMAALRMVANWHGSGAAGSSSGLADSASTCADSSADLSPAHDQATAYLSFMQDIAQDASAVQDTQARLEQAEAAAAHAPARTMALLHALHRDGPVCEDDLPHDLHMLDMDDTDVVELPALMDLPSAAFPGAVPACNAVAAAALAAGHPQAAALVSDLFAWLQSVGCELDQASMDIALRAQVHRKGWRASAAPLAFSLRSNGGTPVRSVAWYITQACQVALSSASAQEQAEALWAACKVLHAAAEQPQYHALGEQVWTQAMRAVHASCCSGGHTAASERLSSQAAALLANAARALPARLAADLMPPMARMLESVCTATAQRGSWCASVALAPALPAFASWMDVDLVTRGAMSALTAHSLAHPTASGAVASSLACLLPHVAEPEPSTVHTSRQLLSALQAGAPGEAGLPAISALQEFIEQHGAAPAPIPHVYNSLQLQLDLEGASISRAQAEAAIASARQAGVALPIRSAAVVSETMQWYWRACRAPWQCVYLANAAIASNELQTAEQLVQWLPVQGCTALVAALDTVGAHREAAALASVAWRCGRQHAALARSQLAEHSSATRYTEPGQLSMHVNDAWTMLAEWLAACQQDAGHSAQGSQQLPAAGLFDWAMAPSHSSSADTSQLPSAVPSQPTAAPNAHDLRHLAHAVLAEQAPPALLQAIAASKPRAVGRPGKPGPPQRKLRLAWRGWSLPPELLRDARNIPELLAAQGAGSAVQRGALASSLISARWRALAAVTGCLSDAAHLPQGAPAQYDVRAARARSLQVLLAAFEHMRFQLPAPERALLALCSLQCGDVTLARHVARALCSDRAVPRVPASLLHALVPALLQADLPDEANMLLDAVGTVPRVLDLHELPGGERA